MIRDRSILGAAALACVAVALAAAGSRAAHAVEPTWFDDSGYYDTAIRFGWWGVDTKGSQVKTGEYQDWSSSPFWDFDRMVSDGARTIDLTITGVESENTTADAYYFGPRVSAEFDYDRFLHRFETDPLDNFAVPDAQQGATAVLARTRNDLGQDYAIRVQEFGGKFQGRITDNIKWRLNLWGLRKEGDRQAMSVAHCYNYSHATVPAGYKEPGQTGGGGRCHVLSQSQRIDWTTLEMEPVIEANFGAVTLEYSRTMRTFGQDDGLVSRHYTQTTHAEWQSNVTVPYAVAVENYTQIDRLKTGVELNEYNHFYSYMYIGNTHNRNRDVHRYFNGLDFRLTNDRIDGVTITGYWKRNNESGELPSTFPEAGVIVGGDTVANYHHPINYSKTATGVKGRWVPEDSGWPAMPGVAFLAGYEYSLIDREYAVYELHDVDDAEVDHGLGEFAQPNTNAHTFHVGASKRWSSTLDSYVGYKNRTIDYPLFGTRHATSDINTMLPRHEDLIEIRGTWMPAENFLLSATFGIEKRHHSSYHPNLHDNYDLLVDENNQPLFGRPLPNPRLTEFDEDNYPIVLSAWYAPTAKWSFTGGYAHFTNWIDQLITLGNEYNDGVYNPGARNYVESDAFQSMWQYVGRASVVNFGAAYALTQRVRLTGDVEWVRGRNTFAAPAPDQALSTTGAVITPDWSDLPSYSAVIVETTRLSAGVDWLMSNRISSYFRYVLYDYEDATMSLNSGTAHGFLAGLDASF